jgi:chromosome partitioning protein
LKIIALYNIKGGVGKTVTSVNLAYLASRESARTLLCDLDLQGSASFYLRIKASKKYNTKEFLRIKTGIDKYIKDTDFEYLDLLPSDISYRNLDIKLSDLKNPKKHLKKILKPLASTYKYIFLDCPPNLTLLSENVFHAADKILVPFIPTTLSEMTYKKMLKFFKSNNFDRSKLSPFFSMVEMRKKLHKSTIKSMVDKDNQFLQHLIPYASDVEKMGIYRKPLLSYSLTTEASLSYIALWQELKTKIDENRKNTPSKVKDIFGADKLKDRPSQINKNNVKENYVLQTQTKKILQKSKSIPIIQSDQVPSIEETRKPLYHIDKMIVSDIDYTLVGINSPLKDFINIVKNMPNKIGFVVATGRSVSSTHDLLNKMNLPLPKAIISSAGSEIYYNYDGEQIYSRGWDTHISYMWNRDTIADLLSGLQFLQLQETEAQRIFKISYYTSRSPEKIKMINRILIENNIKANIIFSHGLYLDIVPFRASRGKAILYLANKWNIPYDNILVAGESGIDREILNSELLGVVVANHTSELENLKGKKKVYFSSQEYAGGLIDGIKHYNFLDN